MFTVDGPPIDTEVAAGRVPLGIAGGQPHGGAGMMSPCAACASSALAATKISWKLPFPVRWQIPLSTAYWSVPLEDVVPAGGRAGEARAVTAGDDVARRSG